MRKFKLKYAPHFGMFEHSAGKDLVDQLKFMADQGFTGLEDNGMMGRTPEVQSQLGEAMNRLGIEMGVFVIQTGGNNSDRFTTGKPENPEQFRKACEAAVESPAVPRMADGGPWPSSANCRSACARHVIARCAPARRAPKATWCGLERRRQPYHFWRRRTDVMLCRAVTPRLQDPLTCTTAE